jgi:hypothetical protein
MVDRSQFGGTPLEVINTQEKENEAKKPYGKNNFHRYDEGENKFRMYPSHPNVPKKSFTYPQRVVFLDIEVEETNDGGQKVKVIRQKPIFNAIVHSDIMKKDLVDEYIQFVKNVHKNNVDKDELTRVWNLMLGKNGKLKSTDGWMAYADKYVGGVKTFGLLLLKTSVKNSMNAIASELSKNFGSIDPFTPADDGICIIVTKDKEAGEKDASKWYTVKLESEMIDRFNQKLIPTPLTDEDLEKFLKEDPLYNKYVNSYCKEDFVYQVEGLQRFDATNQVGIFEYEEFQNIIAELSEQAMKLPSRAEQYPEETESNTPVEQDSKMVITQTPTPANVAGNPQGNIKAEIVKTDQPTDELLWEDENKELPQEADKGYPASWDTELKQEKEEKPVTPESNEQGEDLEKQIQNRLSAIKNRLGN